MVIEDEDFSLWIYGPFGLTIRAATVLFKLLKKSESWAVTQRSGARL